MVAFIYVISLCAGCPGTSLSGKSGVRAGSGMSEHRGRLPGSSSNRQRGCSVALLGKYRRREVPKPLLLEGRALWVLLFLICTISQLFMFVKFIKKRSDILI